MKYALAEKYKSRLGKRFRLIGRTEVFVCTHVADLGVCIAVKGRSSEHMADARFADVVWIEDASTPCSVPETVCDALPTPFYRCAA